MPLLQPYGAILLLGEYRCEVEWSNEKEPLQVTHLLEVLVSPTVSFVPSTRPYPSSIGSSFSGMLSTVRSIIILRFVLIVVGILWYSTITFIF